LLEFFGGLVERVAQFIQLFAKAFLKICGIAVLSELARLVGELRNRLGKAARNKPCENKSCRKRESGDDC